MANPLTPSRLNEVKLLPVSMDTCTQLVKRAPPHISFDAGQVRLHAWTARRSLPLATRFRVLIRAVCTSG
jgi:hypothetical protein